ncbi:hypothetical protein G6F37_001241 [Rhizopus arrhizus]|nr:hypothetical protein G6F38_005506 [Rhizopus arrhizus]KAG1163404.1 hypothetical protein G6F37_001241 [Rhizopus arrhizus]
MEKFKEKLNSLRAKVEAATATGDEYAEIIKQLETQDIQRHHEINSLQSKIELLERTLEKTESELKVTSLKSQEADNKAENLEREIAELEQELENAEKRNDELKELNKTIKAEMEEYERQLEVA